MTTTTGVVETGSARIAFRCDGPAGGPVVVLSSSLGTTMDMWDPQVSRLSGYLRVIRYDHRGHGGSSAPPGPYTIDQLAGDLLAVLDQLGIEHASLVGLSLGGMVSMAVASSAPDRVDRLVLACTAARLGPAEAWHDRARLVRKAGTSQLLATLLPRWFSPRTLDERPQVDQLLATMLSSCDSDGYASCCEAIASMDQRSVLATISADTLVIAGADDPVTPPEMALELSKAIAGSSLLVLSNAAHLANLDAPDRFSSALLDHLTGLPADRGMSARRQVLGEAHVARASSTTSPFTTAFQDLITRYAWGEIWSRPGLDRRIRSAVTLTALVALGRFDELTFHVPAALRNGLSEDELAEILLQCAIYAGVPAANSAFAVADKALAGRADKDSGDDG